MVYNMKKLLRNFLGFDLPSCPGPPFITAKEEVGDPGILCFTTYFNTSDFEGREWPHERLSSKLKNRTLYTGDRDHVCHCRLLMYDEVSDLMYN